jgi:nitrite reductase/ring-hydroxylating ferredoxin subunit
MGERPENRVDRIVKDLLRGRRLRLRGGDGEEKDAIIAAASLAAAGQGAQRMHPAFRKRLAQELESVPTGGRFTRRAALVAGLGVAAGAVTGGVIGKALEPAPSKEAGGRQVTPINGRWVDVGGLADFDEGQAKRVTVGAIGAYLFRRGDTVTAVSAMCSHLPCELQWNGGSGVLDCPCHPASFNPDGTPTNQAYALPRLDVVSVRVTGAGRVEVLGT